MPKKDFSQIAFDVVQRATGEKTKTPKPTSKHDSGRNLAGKNVYPLTPEDREELAVKAAGALGNKNAPTPSGAGARKR
jgi:hypothetical protein